ncbi:MAG: hydrogenase [Firmicutes bacterium HGW-Firmicutes-19]|jgi:NADH-quinone oxidoreductase subunit F|nr:MAG: hydrogenase [Firmicutes bacterium HGW-Firmicutes-19]
MKQTINTIHQLNQLKTQYLFDMSFYTSQVLICGGAGCVSSNCDSVHHAVNAQLEELKITEKVKVFQVGCMGMCAVGPVMLILPERTFYTNCTPESAKRIITSHLINKKILLEHTFFDQSLKRHVPCIDDIDFFKAQIKIALRNCGVIENDSIKAYIAKDGYFAIAKILKVFNPLKVIEEITSSGLRGRGGAGFLTGVKWKAGYLAKSDQKYMICNADEGDPGAFMDRSIIEGDPHSVIEGMMIAGYAIGASKGYIYIRAEYPLAIKRLTFALNEAKEFGLLNRKIFESNFSFDIEIRIGAGAFVCGEETALIASIEGKRGEPSQKPPYPFQKGVFSKPTIINNVETLASVAPIMLKGASWYSQYGTESSKGTKVFALAGDIVNTGIVEVPIGTPIGDILFNIGGGISGKKKFKAAQIGGPSGGCITLENLNTPTDYDQLAKLGAIMGSGGLIAMDEDTCMVDTARFFMDFIQDESCGKCLPCRLGTKQMLEILERITQGKGVEGDIELLVELGETIQQTAICGLGQSAPNPVLSTIRYFREEYEQHIKDKYCKAGVCSDLFISPCENTCPANINVPGYIRLIAAGRFMDAYQLIRQENPFPAICGRICTRPCESKCRRSMTDEAVAICDLKRFAADYAYRNEKEILLDAVMAKNGKKVAIVGAGASGLTCGYYLVRNGYEVDVFEQESIAGGVLAFGIPEYRLPKEVLAHEVSLIEKTGVRIHLNTLIGKDLSFDHLKNNYDSVYLATGTQFPEKIRVEGEDLPGVVHGIHFLKDVNTNLKYRIDGKVVVIGGGNTAIDSARTALRCGASEVVVLYRRTIDAMPAYEAEIHEAILEGVKIIELASPKRFIAGSDGTVEKIECVKMQLAEFDSSGRRKSKPIEKSNFMVDADMVIVAVSQYSDLPFIKKEEIGVTKWGTFVVQDDTLMTTMKGVFAGGDVARGPDTVIQAIADGKRAAESIDKYLGGRGLLNKGMNIDIPTVADEDEIVALHRFPLDILKLENRKNSFDEVILGYHKLNAMAEAMRCLHCDRR